MMEVSSEFDQKLQALIVPMGMTNVVLPQSMVAEIMATSTVRPIPAPAWVIGLIEWRALEIPLISFEALCDEQAVISTQKPARRVAVLHSCVASEALEFYAVQVSSIPHPVRLGEADFQVLPQERPCDVVAERVIAAGVRSVIPDFHTLEQHIRSVIE